MARSLVFAIGESTFEAPIERVDRSKLYGRVERKAYDRQGKECYYGSISADGLHIFGKEAFEQGYLDSDGEWLESRSLTIVDEAGDPLEKKTSSFKETVELKETVSEDEFLLHIARSVYQLEADQELLKAVREAEGIYTFEYAYNDSYSPDQAFLIESNGTLFMIIGEHGGFDFIGLSEAESPESEPDEDSEEDDAVEALDFGMF